MPETSDKELDIAIAGAGILGTSVAYFLSRFQGLKIGIFDREDSAAKHASSRNTGVIHRPFYIDPVRKPFFAEASSKSYSLWKDFASEFTLPWHQNGTLEVARDAIGEKTLRKYAGYAQMNGMEENEFSVLDISDLRRQYPQINALAGFYSRTDTAVDYGLFSSKLLELAQASGVKFFGNHSITAVSEDSDGVLFTCRTANGVKLFRTDYFLNLTGTGSLKLANSMGLALNYGLLLFRGDYWRISNEYTPGFSFNLYTVPRYSRFPFLDPHFINRWNGVREIGPNASLIFHDRAYSGSGMNAHNILESLNTGDVNSKIRLLSNPEFLRMLETEWESSKSKFAMAARLRRYLPSLSSTYIGKRGLGGIRGSVVDSSGFVPEALEFRTEHSMHMVNYNSPGATGSPYVAFSIIKSIIQDGYVHLKTGEVKKLKPENWEKLASGIEMQF